MNELIDVSPSGGFMEMYDGINSKAINPTVLMILSITIVFYLVIFHSFELGSSLIKKIFPSLSISRSLILPILFLIIISPSFILLSFHIVQKLV